MTLAWHCSFDSTIVVTTSPDSTVSTDAHDMGHGTFLNGFKIQLSDTPQFRSLRQLAELKLGETAFARISWEIETKHLSFVLEKCSLTMNTFEVDLVRNECFSEMLAVSFVAKNETQFDFKFKMIAVDNAKKGTNNAQSGRLSCTIRICAMENCLKSRTSGICDDGIYKFSKTGGNVL